MLGSWPKWPVYLIQYQLSFMTVDRCVVSGWTQTIMYRRETDKQYITATNSTERDEVMGSKLKTVTSSTTVMTEAKQTTQRFSNGTTEGMTLVTGNSTAMNTSTYEDTNAPLAAIIAGTITGSLIVIACVVLLLIVCKFSKRNVKNPVDRVSHSHIYVNHGVVAHSIEDDSKTGIPRNISWKSLEQTHQQENNVYCLAKDLGVANTKTNDFPYEKAKLPMPEKQVSETDDNYFILEKFYMNNDCDSNEEYYENCVLQRDNVNDSDVKRENYYSLEKVPCEEEKSKNDEPSKPENIGNEPVSLDKSIDEDVYNKLGENSRNNSVVSAIANYDTMENILHENRHIETDELYYNDEDYSDNYDVLQFARKSRQPSIIPDNPYSTTEQIKQSESP